MELGDFDIIYLWIDPGNCLFATIRLVDSYVEIPQLQCKKNKKALEASFATFSDKIFDLHTCNTGGKVSKVFFMTIFSFTEI